jgi:hypothetical protein
MHARDEQRSAMSQAKPRAPLQVEPVRWSKERQRKVLHAAVSSVVTSEMIRAATFAVSTGYCGSLSRRTSSRADVSYTMQQLPWITCAHKP